MTRNNEPVFGGLRDSRILLIAVLVAYVLTGLLGINRLAWVAAHQGRYYTSYWLSIAIVSFLLFAPLRSYMKRGITQATCVGIVVGYLASCVSGVTMYFQRGVAEPVVMLRHEAATYGLGSLLVTHFIVVLIAGGPVYGCLVSITAFSLDTRSIRVLLIVFVTVALVASTLMIVSGGRGYRQIQLLP
jgi:hypothetical protein